MEQSKFFKILGATKRAHYVRLVDIDEMEIKKSKKKGRLIWGNLKHMCMGRMRKNLDGKTIAIADVSTATERQSENINEKNVAVAPAVAIGKTLEESARSDVYFEGNGEYLVIGGMRYTARFYIDGALKQQMRDASTQYCCNEYYV